MLCTGVVGLGRSAATFWAWGTPLDLTVTFLSRLQRGLPPVRCCWREESQRARARQGVQRLLLCPRSSSSFQTLDAAPAAPPADQVLPVRRTFFVMVGG